MPRRQLDNVFHWVKKSKVTCSINSDIGMILSDRYWDVYGIVVSSMLCCVLLYLAIEECAEIAQESSSSYLHSMLNWWRSFWVPTYFRARPESLMGVNNSPTVADADNISESLMGVNNSPTAAESDNISLWLLRMQMTPLRLWCVWITALLLRMADNISSLRLEWITALLLWMQMTSWVSDGSD